MISTIFTELEQPRDGDEFKHAIEKFNRASTEIYNTTLRYQPYAEKLANATSIGEMKSILLQLQFALQGNKKGI
jgi:ABC-type cobalt transport system substrate-binding protein